MKTLTALTLTAAVGAVFLSPLSFGLSVLVFFAAGLGAITVVDYRRVNRRIPTAAASPVPLSRKERFGLAA
jgi:hypothetical protein